MHFTGMDALRNFAEQDVRRTQEIHGALLLESLRLVALKKKKKIRRTERFFLEEGVFQLGLHDDTLRGCT